MRLLELFSGTGSIGKAFRARGHEVVALDIDKKSGADIVADILTWDFTDPALGKFDMVWASPVCTHYSIARRSGGPPNLEWADSLVNRTLEIISFFMLRGCKLFMFENPHSGLLKTRAMVLGIPFHVVDYCQYSGFKYRKRTALWSNITTFKPRRCDKNTCHAVIAGTARHAESAQDRVQKITMRHAETAQTWGSAKFASETDRVIPRKELYVIPPELCEDICIAAEEQLRSFTPQD